MSGYFQPLVVAVLAVISVNNTSVSTRHMLWDWTKTRTRTSSLGQIPQTWVETRVSDKASFVLLFSDNAGSTRSLTCFKSEPLPNHTAGKLSHQSQHTAQEVRGQPVNSTVPSGFTGVWAIKELISKVSWIYPSPDQHLLNVFFRIMCIFIDISKYLVI